MLDPTNIWFEVEMTKVCDIREASKIPHSTKYMQLNIYGEYALELNVYIE